MTAAQPSDAAQRQAAIDPSDSFIVQAPAGSGKTELLTDRLLALLALVNRPEEIVAITFTRKAAAEMQARVLAKLQSAQGPEPSEPHLRQSWHLARQALARDAELGWNLLRYPARLNIRTIDAFCAALVRTMPWSSTLGGVPAITDDARALYEEAAIETLSLIDEMPAVANFVEHLDVDLRSAVRILADMLASRDQWLPLLSAGADSDLLQDHLHDAVAADLRRLSQLMPLGWAQRLAPWAAAAAAELLENDIDPSGQSAESQIASLAQWQGEAPEAHIDAVKQWHAVACLLLTNSNTLRKSVTRAQGFSPKTPHKEGFTEWLKAQDPEADWVAALADIRNLPPHGYQDDQLSVLGDLLTVLWLAAAQLSVVFSRHAEVDFTEIALKALHALGRVDSPSELLLALDHAIQHILIDEFQDTSHLQIRLLEHITSGWELGDGRTLFLVGDPMQSIYRFRKAEVAWFLRVQEEGIGTVALKPLQLQENFRSKANVVEWVNTTFTQLFPAQANPEQGAIPYTPSVAYHPPVDGAGVAILPVFKLPASEAEGPKQAEVAAAQLAENVVVERVRAALKRHPDSDKPVGILVRARAHVGQLVRRLDQEGINCRAIDLDALHSRQSVSDLVQLARALSHAGDRLAWLAVLRSPLCGLSLHSLHAVFASPQHVSMAVPEVLRLWLAHYQNATDRAAAEVFNGAATVQQVAFEPLDDDQAQRLAHAASVLLDGSNNSGRLPFAAWIEHCWQRLGGPLVYRSAADHSDIERALRLIERLAPFGGLDPAKLEASLSELYAEPVGSGPAVEIMTMHKAKGLEFETVILLGLHRLARSDEAPMVLFEHENDRLLLGPIKARAEEEADPIAHYLAQREKARSSHEVDRLLYVAATRARHQLDLILELNLQESDAGLVIRRPDSRSLLSRLWPYLDEPEVPESLEGDEPPELADVAPMAQPGALLRLRQPLVARLAGLQRRSGVAGVSSALNTWEWSGGLAHEAVVGTVAHAWLERLGRDGLAQWPVERLQGSGDLMQRQLARAGLPSEAQSEAVAVLQETLLATLASDRGRWLLEAARAYREWSLLDASGRVSIIDLAIADEQGWLVVDFKTTVPLEGESLPQFEERMLVVYGEQLAGYCRQVERLDGRGARGALFFPRVDLWVEVEF